MLGSTRRTCLGTVLSFWAALLCPALSSARGARKPEVAIEAAWRLLATGEVAAASQSLERALTGTSSDAQLLAALARIEIEQRPEEDSLGKAQSYIERGRKLAANSAVLWTEWGYLAMAHRKYPDAVGRLQRVVETLGPNFYRAHHGLARAWVRRGRLDKAREAMRACLDAGPDVAENHWMAGNIELADREDAGSTDRAVTHYLAAMDLDDNEVRYKGWAVMAHFVGRRYGMAAPIEAVMAESAASHSLLLVAEGLRYELVADVAPAKQKYQAAVDADWYNPWAHWCLANVLLGRGNREMVEVAKLNPFFYGPFAKPAAAAEHFAAIDQVAPEFPFRARLSDLYERAAANEVEPDPLFQERVARLRGYLGAIRSSPPNPGW